MGRLKFQIFLGKRGMVYLGETQRTVKFLNPRNGVIAAFTKAPMLKYELIIMVCRDLGIPVPPEVKSQRPKLRGARRVIRRKLLV